jgi:hypothetical protein
MKLCDMCKQENCVISVPFKRDHKDGDFCYTCYCKLFKQIFKEDSGFMSSEEHEYCY